MFSISLAVVLGNVRYGAAAVGASSGCGQPLPSDLTLGGSTFRDVDVTDPDARLGEYSRQYKVSIPNGYDTSKPMPLLFYFHGQDGGDKSEDDKFVTIGNQEGFVVVSPKGMADGAKRYGTCAGTSTAWNVGNAGRLDICTKECQPALHISCLHTANVSNCNWATCYDDFHFFRTILASVKSQLCLDVSRIYATGASNGGMLLYSLQAQLPKGTFAAIVPWYGAFLLNMHQKPPSGTPVLHFHGLEDKTIPAEGTYAYQYYYTPLNETLEGFARENGCNLDAPLLNVPTAWDDKVKGFAHMCVKFQSCQSGVVARCLFPNQAHGFWPNWAEQLTWWFMSNYSSQEASPAYGEEMLL